MKKITTNSYRKLKADLITHPPVNREEEKRLKSKKKKKIYQLNLMVDDVQKEDER